MLKFSYRFVLTFINIFAIALFFGLIASCSIYESQGRSEFEQDYSNYPKALVANLSTGEEVQSEDKKLYCWIEPVVYEETVNDDLIFDSHISMVDIYSESTNLFHLQMIDYRKKYSLLIEQNILVYGSSEASYVHKCKELNNDQI